MRSGSMIQVGCLSSSLLFSFPYFLFLICEEIIFFLEANIKTKERNNKSIFNLDDDLSGSESMTLSPVKKMVGLGPVMDVSR